MRAAMKALAAVLVFAALGTQVAAQSTDAPSPATASAPAPASARPEHWAVPVALEGVPNLHRITPTLYRSEQPTAVGMKNLEKLGIRTVINLRWFNNDRKEAHGTSLRTERVKILTWNVDDKHVVEVMRMLKQTENGPFLIHCQHGADRTGLMSAMYRVLEQGWTADDALAELTEGGYGYHSIWTNILRYVRSADVDKLRAAIGGDSTGSTSTVTVN
jgi:protein tyrosine/serine phosphatase